MAQSVYNLTLSIRENELLNLVLDIRDNPKNYKIGAFERLIDKYDINQMGYCEEVKNESNKSNIVMDLMPSIELIDFAIKESI